MGETKESEADRRARVLHAAAGMRRTLLVVDDEEPILFAMREFFRSRGFEVDCASKLEEAEALLEARRHAALIVDLRLTASGPTEGLQLIERSREISPDTKLLLLTAYGSPEIEREAKQLGVGAFLHKPQPLPLIAKIVEDLLAEEPH
jgi:DNA-binding NtrC family response regulator